MPSQLLHILFGEDVFAEIYRRVESRPETPAGMAAFKAWGKIPGAHGKAFALGCQGPDIFYHSQGRRPVGLEYGTLLHRRGAGVFSSGLLGLSGHPPLAGKDDTRTDKPGDESNALTVYALGFMTHVILDRLTHPFIVYKSGIPSFESSHAFFERIIDVLMLKLLRGAEISSWDQGSVLAETCDNPPLGLRELLARALITAFPERAGRDEKLERRIENAFLDCAGFYRVTAPANTRVKSSDSMRRRHLVYLYPLELPGDIDFLNLSKRPWYHPSCENKEDKRSFPEIYAASVAAAADSLIKIVDLRLKEGAFPVDDAARIIGNGGLNITDESGKPCAPVRTDPLPLAAVLEQQAVLRGV